MRIVGGLEVHRAQITYHYVDLRTGEEFRGQIRPATRDAVRAFLQSLGRKQAAFALEGTTGWRFLVDVRRAGMEAHLAEPAETRARRGPKRRAKTDRAVPDCFAICCSPTTCPSPGSRPITSVICAQPCGCEEHSARRRAPGCVACTPSCSITGSRCRQISAPEAGREDLERTTLPAAARQLIEVGCAMLDHLDEQLDTIDAELIPLARRLYGCQVLSATILAELGDTRRFSSSRQAVRFAGIDVTVSESDGKRSRGRLSRQGSPTSRWALYEAANGAWRVASPDHDYYLETRRRLGTERARLSVARRILRRVHHELAEAGDAVFDEAS